MNYKKMYKDIQNIFELTMEYFIGDNVWKDQIDG